MSGSTSATDVSYRFRAAASRGNLRWCRVGGASTCRRIGLAQRRDPDHTRGLLGRVVEHVRHDARKAETVAGLEQMSLFVEPQPQAAGQDVPGLLAGVLQEVGAGRGA